MPALAVIALDKKKTHLVKDIATEAGIPAPYLAKIIQQLATRVCLNQRGVGGGVTLMVEPASITLFEVCDALDDPIVQKRCMLGTEECSDDRACPCHVFWVSHRGEYHDFLHSTTIADMAAFESTQKARANGEKIQQVNIRIPKPRP